MVIFFVRSVVILSCFCAAYVEAFTGTYGINYGRIANNIPPPDKVVTLLKREKIKNVRIYDSDHTVLDAFRGSGLELVIGLPNEKLKDMSANEDHALDWVEENVQSYINGTHIVGIAVGNEVLGGADGELYGALLGAAKNIYSALEKHHLAKTVLISSAHSQAVFANSYPPSSCVFQENIIKDMKALLQFFSQIGSPFCLNAYPFLAYMGSPQDIDINYALFETNKGIYDNQTGLHYDNMLDAQIDAAYAALEAAGFEKVEVVVTETGWASHGDPNEDAATVSNARTYNYNLRKRLAKKKGTPLRPRIAARAYIFAVFNEYMKPGPTSERNFGLFKADGSIAYDIGFSGLKSSSASSLSLKGSVAQCSFIFFWRAMIVCLSMIELSMEIVEMRMQ